MKRGINFLLVSAVALLAVLPDLAEAQRKSLPRTAVPQSAQTPIGPQMYTSRHFQMLTDLPPAEARELMDRLETMLRLVSGYFGKPCRKPIRMFVVDRLANWPPDQLQQIPPEGLQSIRQGGGLTLTQTWSRSNGAKVDSDSVVCAIADHGTPQHEAIHAYCGVTFGDVGPVWYSEGMAEVGQYWRENDKGVNADPVVIHYLKGEDPKPLMEVINNPLEQTGDSWKNYAWRWAVCHLLGFNSNYTDRFKPLGLSMLAGGPASFATVYGSQAEEIDFEYRLFLRDLTRGYRCDLCSWDWKTSFKNLSGRTKILAKIDAKAGWQASRAIVEDQHAYQISTSGTWQLEKGGPEISAAGNAERKGALWGIIFQDYQLSDPFEIGQQTTFTAPASGKLFLRCGDGWGELADNSGSITVRLSVADAPQ